MAQNTSVDIPAKTWTQITNADATNVTFQNVGGNFAMVKATTNTTAPTNDDGAIRYNPGQGERNQPIVELFPGIAGVRLFVYSEAVTRFVISHA